MKITLFHENEAVLCKPLFVRDLTRNACGYRRANFKDFKNLKILKLKFSGNIRLEMTMLPLDF